MAKATKARKSPVKNSQTAVDRQKKKKATSQSTNSLTNKSRDSYLAALGLYEQALKALQSCEFQNATQKFHKVIDEFPEEKELHERSRLYLRACQRKLQPQFIPESFEEQVYAATLAINAGMQDQALKHLELAGQKEPDSDHIQYMLALTYVNSGEIHVALNHLQQAIELNPDNRFLAQQESSFESLHDNEVFQQVIETPSVTSMDTEESPFSY